MSASALVQVSGMSFHADPVSRVLFVTAPSCFTAYTGTRINAVTQRYALLSYMHLSSYAKKHVPGIDTRVLDLGIERNPWPLLAHVLHTWRPQVVAMTCTTPIHYEVCLISKFAKAILGDEVRVVVGGVHASKLPFDMLTESPIDYVVHEEGEVTFGEICEGRPPGEIAGISYRSDNSRRMTMDADQLLSAINRPGVVAYDVHKFGMIDMLNPTEDVVKKTKQRKQLNRGTQLDSLPLIDLELYDHMRYKNPLGLIARDFPMIQVETSRGCPSRCSFCSADDSYRPMSPERVLEQFRAFKRYGIKEIRWIDDQVAVDLTRVKIIFEMMAKEGLFFYMNFANGVRADRLDTEMLTLGKRVGLYQVGVGFESGDQVALDSMSKGLKDGAAKGFEAARIIRKAGVELVGFFMFGAPGDTEISMQKTLAYAKALNCDYAKVTISTPFPDTRMYEDYKRKGLILSTRWDTYNIHKAEGVYKHPNGLQPEVLRKYYDLFYKEYYLMNPSYLWGRFWNTLRNGTLFYDIFYAVKTFLPRLISGDPRNEFTVSPTYIYLNLRAKVRRWLRMKLRGWLTSLESDLDHRQITSDILEEKGKL